MKKTIFILIACAFSLSSFAQKVDKMLLMNNQQLRENNVKNIYKSEIALSEDGETLGVDSYMHFISLFDNGQIQLERDSFFIGENEMRFHLYHYNTDCNLPRLIESFEINPSDQRQFEKIMEQNFRYSPNCALEKHYINYININTTIENSYLNGIEAKSVFTNEGIITSTTTQEYIDDHLLEVKTYNESNNLDAHNILKLTYHKDWETYQYLRDGENKYEYLAKTVYLNNQLLERSEYNEQRIYMKSTHNTYLDNGLLVESVNKIFSTIHNKITVDRIIQYKYYTPEGIEINNDNIQKPQLPKNELAFLASYNGKYANMSKLFKNKAFTQRLKNLLGNRYDELYRKWMLETPIEVKNNVFIAKASELHMPGIVDFIVIFDLKNNVMYAGMKNNITYELFSETGKVHPRLEQFTH